MKSKRKSALWELQNRAEKVGICEMCKKHAELTVDHIFPASLLVMWGLKDLTWEDGENLQLICRTCQTLKKANFNFADSRTVPLIEKYLNLLKVTYKRNE